MLSVIRLKWDKIQSLGSKVAKTKNLSVKYPKLKFRIQCKNVGQVSKVQSRFSPYFPKNV